jgi:hypothetical protein
MAGQAQLEALADSFNRSALLLPATSLREFVATISDSEQPVDRRRSTRYSLVTDVTVVPLDELLRPVGTPFIACSRNISTGGLCLYHESEIAAPFLYVEIEKQGAHPLRAVMKVLRRQQIGRFFEAAGEFTADLSGERLAG